MAASRHRGGRESCPARPWSAPVCAVPSEEFPQGSGTGDAGERAALGLQPASACGRAQLHGEPRPCGFMFVRQAQQFGARAAGAGLFEHAPDEAADAANERGARRRDAASAKKTCRESMGTGSHDGEPWKGKRSRNTKRRSVAALVAARRCRQRSSGPEAERCLRRNAGNDSGHGQPAPSTLLQHDVRRLGKPRSLFNINSGMGPARIWVIAWFMETSLREDPLRGEFRVYTYMYPVKYMNTRHSPPERHLSWSNVSVCCLPVPRMTSLASCTGVGTFEGQVSIFFLREDK